MPRAAPAQRRSHGRDRRPPPVRVGRNIEAASLRSKQLCPRPGLMARPLLLHRRRRSLASASARQSCGGRRRRTRHVGGRAQLRAAPQQDPPGKTLEAAAADTVRDLAARAARSMMVDSPQARCVLKQRCCASTRQPRRAGRVDIQHDGAPQARRLEVVGCGGFLI